MSKFAYAWGERFVKETLLEKKIDNTSRYYRNYTAYRLTHYEVANEGKKNVLLLVGDSHGRFTGFRFGKLYEEAVK